MPVDPAHDLEDTSGSGTRDRLRLIGSDGDGQSLLLELGKSRDQGRLLFGRQSTRRIPANVRQPGIRLIKPISTMAGHHREPGRPGPVDRRLSPSSQASVPWVLLRCRQQWQGKPASDQFGDDFGLTFGWGLRRGGS